MGKTFYDPVTVSLPTSQAFRGQTFKDQPPGSIKLHNPMVPRVLFFPANASILFHMKTINIGATAFCNFMEGFYG